MEKQKCPELRFKGFLQPWDEIRLGNATNCYSGGTPSVGIKSFYGGDIPFIRSGEINDSKTELFLTEEGVENSSAKLVKKNDVLYALYGATSGEVSLSKINGAINQAILAIIPCHSIESEFIVYWLKKAKSKILGNYLQGGQGNLSAEIVKNLIVNIPHTSDDSEQIQIGEFFQNIDKSIALHEKKFSQTQNLKKAMLEKMFPKAGSKQPEIRLKGFNGDWEKKLLDDEVEFFSGLTYSPDDVINKNGTLVLRSSNVQGNQICTDDNVYVVHDAVNVCNVEVGDIIVVVRNGSRSLIGKHAVINKQMKNTVIGAFMTGVKAKNPYFINALFDTSLFDVAVSRNLGATINQITTGMFKQMEFKFPNKTEQIAIGKFFKQLDETLVLQQQQLQTLKNLKRAFLEKMFV